MTAPQMSACLKCGWCCRSGDTVIGQLDGEPTPITMRFGAQILEAELGLFAPGETRPYLAIGDTRPGNILTWQVATEPCPKLDSDGLCAIYDTRPMTCRAYPLGLFEAQKRHALCGHQCAVVRGIAMGEMVAPYEMLTARQELLECMSGLRPGVRLWLYDLNSNEWIDCERLL